MKIAQINATSYAGSTGKICNALSNKLTEEKYENYIISPEKYLKNWAPIYYKSQALLTRLDGMYGFHARWITRKQIKDLNQIKPSILILHNLHNHNINLPLLFKWVNENNVKVVWVFHDCWAFTGHCTHFTIEKCLNWKLGCTCCPIPHEFSWIFDVSEKNLEKKMNLLLNANDMTVVTPSLWLASIVRQSFLGRRNIRVINNGIDLSVFRPTISNFRKNYGIQQNKFVLLGVAFDWGERKGLDVFVELSHSLDPNAFQIVLVGTNKKIDRQLPDNIISIHRTSSQQELASIYTAANLFVNPTREDNYPTVNMEAIACGTPVLTYRTGGSPEIIDEDTGSVVDYDDLDALKKEIIRIYQERPFLEQKCLEKAKNFNQDKRINEYIELIEGID